MKKKILLLCFVIWAGFLTAVAQPNGKSRSGNGKTNSNQSQQRNSQKVNTGRYWDDSLSQVKTPQSRVNKMEDESKERSKQSGNKRKNGKGK